MVKEYRMTCDEARADLPWKVNGTLEGAALRRLDAHLASCSACAAAYQAESRLAARLRVLDSQELQEHRAWRRMESSLSAEGARPAHRSQIRWPQTKAIWRAAAMIGMIAVLFAAWQGVPRAGGEFVTLTTQEKNAAIGASELRVLPLSPANTLAVRGAMRAAGISDITGPSEAGLLRGRVSQDDLASALAQLRKNALVALAVTEAIE